MLPTMRPRDADAAAVRSTCRSLDPNGDTSSNNCSQVHRVATKGVFEYSGRLSANWLTSRPS
jgi:hypothetical protein